MRLEDRPESKECEERILNPFNQLVVHSVTIHTAADLIDGALALTKRSFPHEPMGVEGMRKTYEALLCGAPSGSGEELGEFFIYSLPSPSGAHRRVVAQAGFYRNFQVEKGMEKDGARLLTFINRLVPRESQAAISELGLVGVSDPTGGDLDRLNQCFLWGGRFSVDESVRHSPGVMPFIIRHIFAEASEIVVRRQLLPILFAFTQSIAKGVANAGGEVNPDLKRAQRVHAFYESLQFEDTGCRLLYNSISEDVLGVSLAPDAPVWRRLAQFNRR